jgi:hypothetical protein
MPHAPEWIHRLTEIQEILSVTPGDLLDRVAIENIFQVSARQSNRILKKMGAAQAGGAMVIRSEDLLARLSDLQKEESVSFEQRRRERLDRHLSEVRKEIRARRVQVQIPPERFVALPEDIHFTPGELRIRFTTPLQLIENLMILAKAASEDWQEFESQAVGRGSGPPK